LYADLTNIVLMYACVLMLFNVAHKFEVFGLRIFTLSVQTINPAKSSFMYMDEIHFTCYLIAEF